MPVIRTRNAVLIIGTAIGLVAATGSASAQTYDQNPMRLAQMRGGGFGGGGGGGATNPDEEKKKKEEERRKHEQAPKAAPHGGPGGGGGHPQPQGGFGGPGGHGRNDGPGAGGGGRDDGHRGRIEERQPPRTLERNAPPPRPSQLEMRRDEDKRDHRPGLDKPPVRQAPAQLEPKHDDMRRGGADDRRPDHSKGLPGGMNDKPGARGTITQQPPQGEPKKDEPRTGQPGGMFDRHGPKGAGGNLPPQGEPKKDEPRTGQPGGMFDRHGPKGAGGNLPPQGEPKKDEPRTGQPGGMFDRRGPGGDRIDKANRPHLDTAPILPKPTQVEMENRRRERATFSREHLGDISRQRHERKDAEGRVFFEEPGNRRIVREGGRSFIHHDETERLRRGARDFREERGPGGERRHFFTRPDGVVIISIHDDNGRLIRRLRRDRDGREVVFINNDRERWRRHRGHMIAGFGFSVDLAPPVIRIPREEYYVDAESASEDDIYDAFSAPPVDEVEADYTLDEIRYSKSLRDRLRTVNLSNINFEFGSWEVTESQIGRLDVVARAMRAILRRNPDSVFLVGGHTDAVGSDEDNLSLSDRRAESVARVLTDEYGIPAENLVTQGYGEQHLLVETDGPERRNRRVEFQNITPLLAAH